MRTFINDVPRFLAIFDLPNYIVLLYNVPFWGLSWTPLPTLVWDVINERPIVVLPIFSNPKMVVALISGDKLWLHYGLQVSTVCR